MTSHDPIRFWPLRGQGLGHFGIDEAPAIQPCPSPSDGEMVATVEAATICASDAKMVRFGGDYPLFAGRDLEKDPICLGHELALRVAQAGGEAAPFAIGSRIGVQPDVYSGGKRMCIGVNIPGGFADAIHLGREIMQSDGGSMAFPVPDEVGRAATAMLEPLACVEGAFRLWGRSRPDGGRLVVLCADPDEPWVLDVEAEISAVDLVGLSPEAFHRIAPGIQAQAIAQHADILSLPNDPDDLIVLGDCDGGAIGAVFDRLTSGATFTWLATKSVRPTVPVDMAHFHYGKLTMRGGLGTRLSEVLARPIRTDYRQGGSALIFGASGAMGRFHLMRAIERREGPSTIVALARRSEKLAELVDELQPLAKAQGRRLHAVATEQDGWQETLGAIAEGRGFDEVIVVAPGGEPMNQACDFVADGGLLVGFAGTKAGETVNLPLGGLANRDLSITASSGSTVEDQLHVVRAIQEGSLTPERHVAAVCGLDHLHAGMAAVLEGRFSGKVLVIPSLDWPLTPIDELLADRPELAKLASDGRYWSKEIEDVLLGSR